MRFRTNTAGNFAAGLRDAESRMAQAATAAMKACADNARDAAGRVIAAAGFPPSWSQGMQDKVFPANGASLNPTAVVFHRIPYAGVFQEGAIIRGRPLLWLPIEKNLPGGKWTPKTYAARFGRLVSVNRPGHKPLLFDRKRNVPVFVGIDQVHLPKLFDATGAIRRAVDDFDNLYHAHLKVD